MIRQLIAGVSLLTATAVATAEIRYYTEYKHDMNFINEDYVDNSARNNLRFGAQGEVLYLELGPTERSGEFGGSYEVGYKYSFNENWQIKGKLEGFQFDNYEGDVGSKFETEVRYYFN